MHGTVEKTRFWNSYRDRILAEMAEAGFSAREAAENLGCTKSAAISHGHKIGVIFQSVESNVARQEAAEETAYRREIEVANDRFLSLLVQHHPEQLRIKWETRELDPPDEPVTDNIVPATERFDEPSPPYPKLSTIIAMVASYYDMSYGEVESGRRDEMTVRARHVAMYLCRTMTRQTLPRIAARFGNMDHTSILHGVRKIASHINVDARLSDEVAVLKINIRKHVIKESAE